MLEKLKKFFNRSAEHRMETFNILGFIVFPVTTLLILYVIVRVFFPLK
jgi:hypothetical protein